jgi:hypothetical protein
MADSAYTIRPFPRELHRKAKATAALEGITLRELILKALGEYVDKQQKHLSGNKPTLEEIATKLDNEGGLSLERIALDYYPEFFNPGDIQQAKKNLGIEF